MGPIALKLYKTLETQAHPEAKAGMDSLQGAAHFQIDIAFFNTCVDIASKFPCAEFSGRLPAESVMIHVTGNAQLPDVAFFLGPDVSLPGVVSMSMFTMTEAHSIGHWRPQSKMVGIVDTVRAGMKGLTAAEIMETDEFLTAHAYAESLSTICELLCEPRLVERTGPSRTQRRQAERELKGKPLPTTWARVTWNVGDTTRVKGDRTGEGHGTAYHMVRAHWRNYGDRQTKTAIQRPGRGGWWVWIDSHHSGNPAFGIVGHRYEPKLHESKSVNAIEALIASRKLSS